MKSKYLALVLIAFLFVISGCIPSKKLRKGEYLLVSNSINIDKDYKKAINKDNLYTYIQQTSNQKFLFFFPANLWIDSWAKAKKPTKFKQWVVRNFSTPPAIYDKFMTDNSVVYLNRYLQNIGYFNAKVSAKADYNPKNGKVSVVYNVEPNKPYILNQLYYRINDTAIAERVFSDREKCLIKTNEIYNYFQIAAERDRLTDMLREHGYYDFNADYIYYEIDSSFNDHKLDVYLNIRDAQKKDSVGQLVNIPHVAYKINNIYVYPWGASNSNKNVWDTIPYAVSNWKDSTKITYYNFIRNGKIRVRNKVLANAIPYSSMELFDYRLKNLANKNFMDIPIFYNTDISFSKAIVDTMFSVDSKYGLLDCNIKLNPAALNSVGFGFDVTTAAGDWGIKGSTYWENKNIFKGGEVLNISLSANLQSIKEYDNTIETSKFLWIFNSTDVGIKATLMFPRFFFPINIQRLNKKFRPTTNVLLGINYQKRPYYERWISTATFGYRWRATTTMEHTLNPIEISAVKMTSDSELDKILNINSTDPRLAYQYTDHLLEALHYTFLFNNQSIGASNQNYTYFRADAETSGNLIQLVNVLGNWGMHPEGYRTVFGIRYAQYARFNFEGRRCWYLGKLNAIAGRALFGFGVPYGNSSSLPYEKAFFAGGANGMRGWQYRFLGPGGYIGNTSASNLERIGDMQIEFNAEWRFPIYSYLKGALFADVGNIWLLRNDPNYPNGTFRWNDFYKQFAFDFGLGLRLDISFIVIRLDAALPAYDPGKVDPWRIKTMKFKEVVWNFAIGYPF